MRHDQNQLRNFSNVDIIIIIIIIIITVDLITLLGIYLLGNIRLSQAVGGIRLSQGKEIHPIP